MGQGVSVAMRDARLEFLEHLGEGDFLRGFGFTGRVVGHVIGGGGRVWGFVRCGGFGGGWTDRRARGRPHSRVGVARQRVDFHAGQLGQQRIVTARNPIIPR